MPEGCDISEHQGDLPPEWFDQWEFVIIRGHSGYRTDLKFAQNWANAKGRTRRGIYGYLVPDRDPAQQADELAALVAHDPPEFFYWSDAEQDGLTADHAVAHCERLSKHGPTGFYSYVPFLTGPLGADPRLRKWPLWVAGYGPNDGRRHKLDPGPPWPGIIHQYSSADGLDRNWADSCEFAGSPMEEPDMKSLLIHKPGEAIIWVYDASNGTKTKIANKATLDGMVFLAAKTGLDCGPNNTGYEAAAAFIDGLVEIT